MGTAAQDTRRRLLLTAERLFAERGIGVVSLREIAAAAGERNNSAVLYHFGSKNGLVMALLEHRMSGINERRLRMIAEMQAQGRPADLRCLLEELVFPLAIAVSAGTTHYGRFLAQLVVDPQYNSYDWESAASFRLVRQGIRRCLAEMPEPVVEQRLRMLGLVLVHTAADHERRGDTSPGETPPAWAVPFVDAVEGMLTAPVSAAAAAGSR
ncbi:TetR/AcrR family transcriptional regulator [Streptomyces sp. NBC_01669]|uniref:TetR/AcrR family transcriptional regulator n=1 Tax=Streptomyces sp. NBC_01669 TaxID=2975909 RepID=UPI00225626FF|nr:TetR/AcrR family transcriptional regulator [Streptomyces sp. NBC_01669]MCX4537702.1 TetR/AcrR family transcriptional regulator [Streptomyces sp. NBC_01669]